MDARVSFSEAFWKSPRSKSETPSFQAFLASSAVGSSGLAASGEPLVGLFGSVPPGFPEARAAVESDGDVCGSEVEGPVPPLEQALRNVSPAIAPAASHGLIVKSLADVLVCIVVLLPGFRVESSVRV